MHTNTTKNKKRATFNHKVAAISSECLPFTEQQSQRLIEPNTCSAVCSCGNKSLFILLSPCIISPSGTAASQEII